MNILIGVFFGLQILILGILHLRSKGKYEDFVAQHNTKSMQLLFMAPLSLYVLDQFQLSSRFPDFVQKIHQKIIKIYGSIKGLAYTRLFLAQVISSIFLTLFLSTFLALAGGDYSLFLFGLVVTPLIAVISLKDLDKRIAKRENDILIVLPELLNKIVLLVNAGETVQQALLKCAHQKKDVDNPLYGELQQMVRDLEMGHSFQHSMEDFSKRCSLHEIALFTTSVLLNYKRGGSELVSALLALAKEAWEKRKAICRILGEEASSKMIFPMVVNFLIILIVIAFPAFMLIGG